MAGPFLVTWPVFGSGESMLAAGEGGSGRATTRVAQVCARLPSDGDGFSTEGKSCICDYSPATLRASVARSLKQLNTTYLDAVYLHNVEFVTSQVRQHEEGHPADTENLETHGLTDGQERKASGKTHLP
ncbi:hypothetical protein FOMPIDRAFT_1053644 [Fomitopsis schrenkii]|uniref:NADP-dependent oxidoreductase domain-containing protein n=1 Tax=Fomitopsis schrenkii TaxID=2126942 RepID=S8FC22_FOMSC|nr:hypothetical protein FOMPIDRAFT_1053644 [Fomitopsis schrenkii]